jgi:2-keto-4-pentenoate hydratase/2-oxohepta-3-ene-1,7-dioic acid hydratase in catechol pathway
MRDIAVGWRSFRIAKILCVARNYADHAREGDVIATGTPAGV